MMKMLRVLSIAFLIALIQACAAKHAGIADLEDWEGQYLKVISGKRWVGDIASQNLGLGKEELANYEAMGARLYDLNGDNIGELFFTVVENSSISGSSSGYPNMVSLLYTYYKGEIHFIKAVKMSSGEYERGGLFATARLKSPRKEVLIIEQSKAFEYGGESNRADYYWLEGKNLVKIASLSNTIQQKSRYPDWKIAKGLPWAKANFQFLPLYPGWEDTDDPYIVVWEKDGAVVSAKDSLAFINRFVYTEGYRYTFLKEHINKFDSPKRFAPEPQFPWPIE